MSSVRPPRLRAAFSLIELLVVLAIIGIVAVFAVPAASTIILGTELTRGSQVMSSQFSQARQAAITRNRTIELRLIKFADPEVPAEKSTDPKTWKFRSIQLMEVLPNGALVALQKPERLPGSVQMNDGPYSSLLSANAETTGQIPPVLVSASSSNSEPALPRMAKGEERNYQYVAFHFLPDGSTDLKAYGKWYVTILTGKDQIRLAAAGGAGGAAPPIRFAR